MMLRRLRSVAACGVVACLMILSSKLPAQTQSTAGFRYVLPGFNGNSGSELVISNLSSRRISPELIFFSSDGSRAVDTTLSILAGSQVRFTAASFGLGSFSGTVMVNSSTALGTEARIADEAGKFESIGPAPNGSTLLVPFVPGADGLMDLTIFNPTAAATNVTIIAVASNGEQVGTVQRGVPALGTLVESVDGLFPETAAVNQDIGHLVVRTLTNVFGADRQLYVEATVNGFAADAEGSQGAHLDPAIVAAVPLSSGATASTVPFLVQGGDYITIFDFVNTSDTSASVTLTAVGLDGNVIPGTGFPTVQVAPNGSLRRSAQRLFNFDAAMIVGSINVRSTTPVITTTALLSVYQNGMVLMPAAEPANTNFVFPNRNAKPELFTGFALMNPGGTQARLTLRNIPDDTSGVTSNTLTIPGLTSVRRSLFELLPEARTGGFIHISSDVPIVAAALEGRVDNGILANLPAMHSQPDYVPPNQTKFLITGTVRHNNVPLAGAHISVTGTMITSADTDDAGNYLIRNVTPGAYAIQASAQGYTIAPPSLNVTVGSESSRNNDFSATLIPPTITFVQPVGVLVGSPETKVIVGGGPFISTSEIVIEGNAVVTSLTTAAIPVTVSLATSGTVTVNQTQTALQGTVPASILTVPRVTQLFVRTKGPGGSVASAIKPFSVGNPAPVLSNLAGVPNPLLFGNPGFTLTVNGTGFVEGTAVQIGGVPIATAFVSSTQLKAFVLPQLLAIGGSISVTALNPQPTVGPSNELLIPIFNPIPGLTSIAPNSLVARFDPNAPPADITVNGFGFAPSAVIQIEGTDIPTSYVSPTRLLGQIPEAQLKVAKIATIKVKNPDPTLGISEALPLSLFNPVPVVTSLDASPILFDPIPRFAGDKPKFLAQVIIHGSNFASEGTHYLIGTPCDTDVGGLTGETVSSTLIIGRLNIACTGTYVMGFTNPQPGGGVSALVGFTVAQYTAPGPTSVTGMSPVAVLKGADSFTLTISGTNFSPGAIVNFGTAVLFPTSASFNTIVVTVPSYLIKTSGVLPVSITNPDVTGNSNRLLFTIN